MLLDVCLIQNTCLKQQGEWDPLVECGVRSGGCRHLHSGVSSGQNSVDDATHIALNGTKMFVTFKKEAS